MARRLHILLLAACALRAALGQPPPAFEAATVKPNRSGQNGIGGRGVCFSAGRVSVTNMPLSLVMEQVYGVKEFQLLARPAWLGSERFDIEAKAGSPVASDQCKLMVQTLLADRFRLALHRETRQLPIYTLVVRKNGPRLRKVDAGAPLGIKTFDTIKGQLSTRGTSMQQLVGMLAMTGELDNLVVDGTGLDGYYEFTLEWTPPGREADAASGPSLFAALQEQLGLKLEPGKGPVEVLVIDHIERVPTEQ